MERDPFDWTDDEARRRERSGLVRTLRPRPAESGLLDLASNDYLGLTRHPAVTGAAAEAARRWGAGATGSRLVTGSTELHAELERELAAFCGFEAALVLSSGYAANLAALTALTARDSLLLSDAGNHASIVDGCRLSRAETVVVPHAEPEAVRKTLDAHAGRRALMVSDAVFSVDGDAAPLGELAEVCRTRGAALLVDDAHGLGVLGAGAGARRTRRASPGRTVWWPPSRSPSPWAARAARYSARHGSSAIWSTRPVRSSSIRDWLRRPSAARWRVCGCCAGSPPERTGRVRWPVRCTGC